jgi:hypothetical protein
MWKKIMGFNEAPADQPGKSGIMAFASAVLGAGFNEAPADQPGK